MTRSTPSRIVHPVHRTLLAVLLAVPLSGCALIVRLTEPGSPSSDDLALLKHESDPYRHRGDSTVAGQVTLDSDAGKLLAPAGVEVLISPVTTYTSERFQEYVLEKNEIP